jgi:hypothetical protein
LLNLDDADVVAVQLHPIEVEEDTVLFCQVPEPILRVMATTTSVLVLTSQGILERIPWLTPHVVANPVLLPP